MTLDDLNRCPHDAFTAALGGLFEHSPWVAERVVVLRPFASADALHAAMCQAVAGAGEALQMALIRAHPQLAGKAAIRGELTESSTNEQRGAGLDQCTPEEFAEITRLNADYDGRFGFPFILAVKGHTRSSILANMRARIGHDRDAEVAEALKQIERIARFRLEALLS
jgi:2-oxo-4-hydroxy-4-carboxy-5-ureidoimidazoline decarboxylase